MSSTPPPPDPDGLQHWRHLLRDNWRQRAGSGHRDFYVASHPGWRDPQAWAAQAEQDVKTMVHGLDGDWLAVAEVLEVGCGVGRLVGPLLARCRGYSGFDIAEEMVEEARRRHAGEAQARFAVGDGTRVPAELRDREYRLILCLAVWIHCPREIIEASMAEAVACLGPGGRLRFQLLGDAEDEEGITAPPQIVQEALGEMAATESQALEGSEEVLELIEGSYYMGQAFGYRDAQALCANTGLDTTLLRPDPHHIYGELRRR